MAAQRSYPASTVRGCGRECQAVTAQEQPKGATPSEARDSGQKEQPHVQRAVVAWVQDGLEELFHIQGQEGGGEEIPLVQGTDALLEQVRETQERR